MTDSKEPKVVNPELSINKKLGDKKFDQVFDTGTIQNAEKTVDQSKEVFKEETSNDYDNLKAAFAKLDARDITKAEYTKLAECAFSIKSRAATGGNPTASEVANSMYKFCDAAALKRPDDGYKVIKLHMDALAQVFEKNFAADQATKEKLVSGLEEVSKRFLESDE